MEINLDVKQGRRRDRRGVLGSAKLKVVRTGTSHQSRTRAVKYRKIDRRAGCFVRSLPGTIDLHLNALTT
ncbi:hypothetical protein CpipJ_CPIJ005353 [Culex quinquefasciatus]|uniref:Uncharacterized protein n=1 Tax=Culex quinquefasciatus TaxID=7176 RepID=B0WDL1_CULQU|nr:hypothetical protein CpipJ_CPIJ005353 [Culex quinquefasciatus]|eukprot:XP_001846795.1 hypothetical protein CpipJ_CPIJ005353 [Culex quinquefasciatus]